MTPTGSAGPSSPTERPAEPEPEVEDAFDRLVEEGEDRLERPLLPLVSVGLLGGIDVGTGVLAYLVVEHQTGSTLLAGLAFSLGFVALLLARSELFTENFLVPVTALVARRGSVAKLLRLWGVTLVANLLAGWVITWLIVQALPDLHPTVLTSAQHYADLGYDLRSFCLAVLAGAVITLMTRMQHATDSMGVKLVPAVLFGALLAGAQLFHCVLDSLLLFAALHVGAPFGYAHWFGLLCWSALGNLAGGLVLVTAVRLLRVPHRIAEERQADGRG
ncbi:formate/nitrite transporter family protein [Kineococcus rubinsiae]|uniref:formate/nitrite transporter family protein n=1 Tax=Kineococcus rubinsiae TaxID=2609562 RepID=UPI0014310F35|nr:formate/nitrite transporter family protein [Kineococcus rubinsiae]NIZ91949.1 formate/nitrite transporter family protein [Kineococcus rubinsiae]